MKYLLIKDYKRKSSEGAEKTLKAGTYIDVGSDKANQLKASGHIESDAEPIKPKTGKKRKNASDWLEENNNDNN